jgi:hypothetical protein
LQAAETGTGNVRSIEDVEDEKTEKCCNKMEIDLANDWNLLDYLNARVWNGTNGVSPEL